MPIATKKITIRVTEDQRAAIALAAHSRGMNVSRYLLALAAESQTTVKQTEVIRAAVTEEINGHNTVLVAELRRIAEQQAGTDEKLRADLRVALNGIHKDIAAVAAARA